MQPRIIGPGLFHFLRLASSSAAGAVSLGRRCSQSSIDLRNSCRPTERDGDSMAKPLKNAKLADQKIMRGTGGRLIRLREVTCLCSPRSRARPSPTIRTP